jgi:hypothetical protein
MKRLKIEAIVEVPDDCDRAALSMVGFPSGFPETADPVPRHGEWHLTKGYARSGRVINWEETLTRFGEDAEPTAGELVVGAAPELFDAVEYLINRIARDPDVQYYCGACTETLARLSRAYGKATGRDAEEIARRVAMADCGEAEVLIWKRRVEEMEAEG